MKKVNHRTCVQMQVMNHLKILIVLIAIIGFSITGAKAQCTIQCLSNVEISLFNTNDLTLIPDMVVFDPYANCPGGSFDIKVFDDNGNHTGDFVNYTMLGKAMTVEVEVPNQGVACFANLKVIDENGPVINCQTAFVMCADSISPSQIGYPTVTDNINQMSQANLAYTDALTEYPCYTIFGDSTVTAKVARNWIAVDSSGNLGSCRQEIFFVRKTLSDVEWPADRDGFAAPYLLCQRDNPNDLQKAGTPAINGGSLNTFNNCELATSYEDDIQTVCGGEQRILRHWTVTDLCLDSSLTHVQLIRLKDIQPPTISLPDSLEFDMNQFNCTATVNLPNPTVTDSCSQTSTLILWGMGLGNGPFTDVPQGFHPVTYTVTDDCGNTASETMIVVIRDKQLPTAVCDLNKELSLLDMGTTTVPASTFDDGSSDNCGIALIEASRDGAPFGEYIDFTCADMQTPVPVKIRVSDSNGLMNECDVEVQIVDNVRPDIQCPPQITIECTENRNDAQITGMPTASDNCQIDTTTFSDNLQVNACGVGQITRHWTASDISGNQKTCTQQLIIMDNTPISIEFPEDYVTYECGAATTSDITGEPIVTGSDCEDLEIKHTDEVYPTAVPACYKIIRTWSVVDFCTFTTTSGQWTAEQIILVNDTIAPEMEVMESIAIGAGNFDCYSWVETPRATATDCSGSVTITNDSPYADANGADASGTYPTGEHTITFSASDGCGNTSQTTLTIRVQDDKPPTPVCNRGIGLSLNSDGMIAIHHSIITNTVFDNCSPEAAIELEIEPAMFTCEHLGDQLVTLYATDQSGNQSFCTTTVEIQDNLGICNGDDDVASIAGTVQTMGGTPAVQVLVGLSGGLRRAIQTDTEGGYRFEDLPKGEDYTVLPTYDVDYFDGVSTLDLVAINKHVLNVKLFDSPYQWIAADANRSGTVTTLDMVVLRKLVLRVIDDLPNNTSWRFIDSNHAFPLSGNPLQGFIPEAISINNLAWNHMNKDFIAVKIGDVTGDATLNTAISIDDRTAGESLILNIENQEIKAGQSYEIPVFADNFENIFGFQHTLQFDKNLIEWQGVAKGQFAEINDNNFGMAKLKEGLLSFSWNEAEAATIPKTAALYFLKFSAKEDAQLSEVFAINSEFIRTEAYSMGLHESDVTVQNVRLDFTESKNTNELREQIHPNPFTTATTLSFDLPNAADVTLKMYDLYGTELNELRRSFPEGKNSWRLSSNDFANYHGTVMYQLITDDLPVSTGKMIRIKI